MESNAKQEPVAWKHDCAALLTNDVELWIDACPHCGKPRPAPQPKPAEQEAVGVPQGWKLVPDVPTNKWINNLAKTQTGPLEDVPFADIYQCIVELLDTAPEAPQLVKREPLTDEEFLQLLLKKGTTELVSWTTFVSELQGNIGLRRGAKLLKEFVESAHGITKE